MQGAAGAIEDNRPPHSNEESTKLYMNESHLMPSPPGILLPEHRPYKTQGSAVTQTALQRRQACNCSNGILLPELSDLGPVAHLNLRRDNNKPSALL